MYIFVLIIDWLFYYYYSYQVIVIAWNSYFILTTIKFKNNSLQWNDIVLAIVWSRVYNIYTK